MLILGISAFYHDSAASLIENGEILAAAQEERFTRKKHEASFPTQAIKYCLEYRGISLADIDAVVFYDKPFLKFERLLETYYAFAPKGLASFLKAMPVWIKEKLFLKKTIREELRRISDCGLKNTPLLFPEHHLSHAASAFYPSPFDEAAILTLDGVGEWATASIMQGKGKEIRVLKEMHFPHSVGLLYAAFTYFLGFRVNSGEYKLMGLAPYGNSGSQEVASFKQTIKEKLMDVYEDGSIRLDQQYFTYGYGLKMVEDKQWEELFGFPARKERDEIKQKHCNLALAIQQITEDIVVKMAKEAKRLTGAKNLCLAGGVALNCVANGVLEKLGIFEHIYIQPAAGDAGASLGAAFAAYHIHFDQDRLALNPEEDHIKGSYLGPEFSELEILQVARKYEAPYIKYSFLNLYENVASLLAEGNIVGWFQGRMEFGPRALGNRSILGDARNPDMQKKMNLSIKYRESFRPFAPSVLLEDARDYFEMDVDSPYMLFVHPVHEKRRGALPQNYPDLSLQEKLSYQCSDIPAVTHVDQSARVQTVDPSKNPTFHALISAFKQKTGYGLVINTSFNVRGEPIVCSPEDAFTCFLRTEMDFLVMGQYVFSKKEQVESRYSQKAKAQSFGID